MKRNQLQHGFTLIELLIVVAIIGIMSVALYGTVVMPLWNIQVFRARELAMADMRQIEKWIGRDIRMASAVSVLPATQTGGTTPQIDLLLPNKESFVRYTIRPEDRPPSRFVPKGSLVSLWRSELDVQGAQEIVKSERPVCRDLTLLQFDARKKANHGAVVVVKAGFHATTAHRNIDFDRKYLFFTDRYLERKQQ